VKIDVRTTKVFERQARRLMKKYSSLKEEIRKLAEVLAHNPTCGTPLGHQCYKIRLAIASKGKGKAGGARIITYFVADNSIVLLLSIYDKSEKITITDKELTELLATVPQAETQS
jgi:mRNA-degrading endonuclease RelE of RelBE toxin-antitoxin system